MTVDRPDGIVFLDGQLSGAIQTWSWDPGTLNGEVSGSRRPRRQLRSTGRFFHSDEGRLTGATFEGAFPGKSGPCESALAARLMLDRYFSWSLTLHKPFRLMSIRIS